MPSRTASFLTRSAPAAAALASILAASTARANSTAQSLPFSQNWSDASILSTTNNWDSVPGIIGYRGDDITTTTAADPQTLTGDGTPTLSLVTHITTPNTVSTGCVGSLETSDPAVALQGSGTADAPNLVLHIDTTGRSSIVVAYNLRDLDGSTDNSVQAVALQYRVGSSGDWTNVAAAFVADATTGPSLATLVTPVSVTLPSAVDNQALVQLRIITANATGNDEWVGVDDISVTGSSGATCGNGTLEAGETCDSGAANGTTECGCTTSCTYVASGTVCGAASGACDAADVCSGAGACLVNYAAAGTVCRAAVDACDVAETCSGAAATCPTDMVAGNGTLCGDSDACNGVEVCSAGVCTSGTPVSCNDGDICTTDACVAATGMCTTTAVAGCCLIDPDCNDSDPCTVDHCSANACVYVNTCGTDAGTDAAVDPDAGTDAAVDPDAGTSFTDAGSSESDAGAGESDAGAGESDAGSGESDAGSGESDAGASLDDAGTLEDAGTSLDDAGAALDDAGTLDVDAGVRDAGAQDGGARDGGPSDGGMSPDAALVVDVSTGCGCSAAGASSTNERLAIVGLAGLVGLLARRRRR